MAEKDKLDQILEEIKNLKEEHKKIFSMLKGIKKRGDLTEGHLNIIDEMLMDIMGEGPDCDDCDGCDCNHDDDIIDNDDDDFDQDDINKFGVN